MTDHVLVAREGRVRLYRMNGHGAEEVASLALTGPLPDDTELAAWSGALVLMTAPRASKAPAKPRALPAAKRTYRRREPGGLRRVVLAGLSDGEWHKARDIAAGEVARGSVASTFVDLGRIQPAMIERRRVPDPKRSAGVYEYRLTDEGRAMLANLGG